ncbi:MAG TPA: hypothetical protein ENI61_01695 [Ignavibacteria bacterium]|nr:hypothetical protein [Ignavibacteria bacterium]
MVQIRQYLKRTNDFQSSKNLPLLNSLFVDRFSVLNPYSKDNNFKTFMKWARRVPQLMGFLNIIATDMLSDEIEFRAVNKSSGRNKIIKARKFWDYNRGIDIAEETIYDLLITGIGYNWLGSISNLQLKEFCKITFKEVLPEIKESDLEFKADLMVNKIKENNPENIVKKLRHVASTTVSIHTDEYEVLKYVQRVGVNYKEFSKDEMLVFKLMPLDGKIYPFPPLEAILSEIYLLWLITQNYVSFFENGGKPDSVFILPKELAGSQNHKYLIDTLRKYKKIQNKHGNLVFTGDLSIEKLMAVESQMENKDLGLYLTSVLAMMYGIPVNRIPFLVGRAASSGDSGGLADTGYWRKISVWQSKLEATYNHDLFIPYFGVKMKFRRGYLQDEVRETQNSMQMNSVAEQRMNLGLWTIEEAGDYLDIDMEVIKEAQKQKSERDNKSLKSGLLNQNLNNNDNVIKNQDAKMKAKKKQDTQNLNQQNAGGKKINP